MSTKIAPLRVDEGAWQSPLVQHKPSIHPPGCLYPASLPSKWGRAHVTACVCVIWSSRWVWMTNCCLCRHLPRADSESCLCVLLCCSCSLLWKRALSGLLQLNLLLTYRDPMQACRFQCWCLFVMCLLSKKAQTVLKIKARWDWLDIPTL